MTYYLWQETIDLLKEFNSGSNPVVQNEKGEALVKNWIDNGKPKKTDKRTLSLGTIEETKGHQRFFLAASSFGPLIRREMP